MPLAIRISLLGRNSFLREGLERVLSDRNFIVVQSADQPGNLTDDGCEDLLLVMQGVRETPDGYDVRTLHDRFPDVKIVVLSDVFEFDAMTQAFRAGIWGYIMQDISSEPLIASLRLVALGEKVMPSHLADLLPLQGAIAIREKAQNNLQEANLSLREGEILRCLTIGCSNKNISAKLAISEATVKVHVKSILRKLRVQNRTQAAIQGLWCGLDQALVRYPLKAGMPDLDHGNRVVRIG